MVRYAALRWTNGGIRRVTTAIPNGEARRASLRSTVLAGAVGQRHGVVRLRPRRVFAPLIGALFFAR
jgi:hypothetical protein